MVIVDMILNDEISMIVNSVSDKQSVEDAFVIRRHALMHKVTNYTTLAAAKAASEAHKHADKFDEVNPLQQLHKEIAQ